MPTLYLIETNRHSDQLDDGRAESMLHSLVRAVESRYAEELSEEATEEGEPLDEPERSDRPRVLIVPDRDTADAVAGKFLRHVLEEKGVPVELVSSDLLASELPARIEETRSDIVVLSAVPPGAGQFAQLVAKRLRRRYPDLPILVGVWEDETAKWAAPRLKEAGVTATESRIAGLLEALRRHRPVTVA
jgi:hypothetical protein